MPGLHQEPLDEVIREHQRLLRVLRSPSHADDRNAMLILWFKAIKTHDPHQGELFNQLDPVKGYVRKDGTFVAPHQAHYQHAIPRRSLQGTQPDIPHLVQAARAKNQGNQEWLEYAKVTQRTAERIQHLIGIHVSDYVHQLDEAGIRHILKEHGNPANEIPRGQIPIQDNDFKRLTDIVNTWDDLTTGNPTPNGIPTLVYRKQFADGETWFVEETRSGRKKLAARTLWKLKGTAAPRATPEAGGVAHTSKTFGGRSKTILPPSVPENKTDKMGKTATSARQPPDPWRHPFSDYEKGRILPPELWNGLPTPGYEHGTLVVEKNADQTYSVSIKNSKGRLIPQATHKDWMIAQDAVRRAYLQKNPLDSAADTGKMIQNHRNLVKQALKEGKAVPPVVLADYPDLTPKIHKAFPRRCILFLKASPCPP